VIPQLARAATKPDGTLARRSTGGRSVGSAVRRRGRASIAIGSGSLRRERKLLEAGRLGQAVHDVERLDGWPAALLTRLSTTPIAMIRPIRSSTFTWTRTWLLPVKCFVAAGPATTLTNGSSSYAARYRASTSSWVPAASGGRGRSTGSPASSG
jgi:hypothetical protein